MIGYYVHHHGSGHLHRAAALARASGHRVTGLSSLEAPAGWQGEWVPLSRDDEGAASPRDPTARGRLHWTPLLDRGLAARWHEMSAWIAARHPEAMVVDVSVEATLLARLHGVPVVGVVLPGRRVDPAHLLAFDVCEELVGAWPPEAVGMVSDLPRPLAHRIRAVGGISRHPVRAPSPRRPGPRRVVLMLGGGGHGITAEDVRAARQQTPDWEWAVLGGELGRWTPDPRALIEDADVVVTHAGQNAVAEVAAARRPAVIVPQPRPFDEQATTARLLARGWPVLVEPEFPAHGWAERLERAAGLDVDAWATWCDGRGAERFAEVVDLCVSAGRRS